MRRSSGEAIVVPQNLGNAMETERLQELLGSAGIPLSSEPSPRDLHRSIELIRRRRRDDLVHFLARLIARDIRERPNVCIGDL